MPNKNAASLIKTSSKDVPKEDPINVALIGPVGCGKSGKLLYSIYRLNPLKLKS